MSNQSLSGFRRLLRSARVVFGGDAFAFANAKIQLKAEFRKNSHVSDVKQLNELYKGIDEVDEMLRFNIVQGSLNNHGNYAVDLSREETQVAIESGQVHPHGMPIEVIDKSVLGDASAIKIERTKNTKK
jgi:hypothetical protein